MLFNPIDINNAIAVDKGTVINTITKVLNTACLKKESFTKWE